MTPLPPALEAGLVGLVRALVDRRERSLQPLVMHTLPIEAVGRLLD